MRFQLLLCALILLITSSKSYSQRINDLFQSQLIADNVLILIDKSSGKQLYNTDKIVLSLDSIYNYRDFKLFRFTLGKNKVEQLDNNIDFSFKSTYCQEYIIAEYDDRMYRLKGFTSNDMLFFLSKLQSNREIKMSALIKELEELETFVDFKNVYKALKQGKYEVHELTPCSAPIPSHGKIR